MSKRQGILRSLNAFYTVQHHFQQLYEILNKKHKISLRTLEYTVINYSKFVPNALSLNGRYQIYLESHGKRFFDAFRRHTKFNYTLGDKTVATNVAQLRFIKFVIENKINLWLKNPNNKKLAEKAMRIKEKLNRPSEENGRIRKKRQVMVVVQSYI